MWSQRALCLHRRRFVLWPPGPQIVWAFGPLAGRVGVAFIVSCRVNRLNFLLGTLHFLPLILGLVDRPLLIWLGTLWQ